MFSYSCSIINIHKLKINIDEKYTFAIVCYCFFRFKL